MTNRTINRYAWIHGEVKFHIHICGGDYWEEAHQHTEHEQKCGATEENGEETYLIRKKKEQLRQISDMLDVLWEVADLNHNVHMYIDSGH